MYLDVLITVSCCVVGLTCGWVAHAMTGALQQPQIDARQAGIATLQRGADGQEPSLEDDQGGNHINSDAEPGLHAELVMETAQQIATVAQSLAADVDVHQSKVDEFNDQVADDLNAGAEMGQNSPQRVMQAVEQLTRANGLMRDQLRAAQQHIREQSEKLETAEREARTDALTQIANRGVFDCRADAIAEEHATPEHVDDQTPVAVMALLDVDRFKIFNDTHGHAAGDQVLKVVASSLHEELSQHGTVTRYGGEEFAVLLNPMPMSNAIELVEAARQQLTTRRIVVDGELLSVTASAGIAALPSTRDLASDEGDDSAMPDIKSAWLQSADDALYRSKEGGRDCAHYVEGGSFARVRLDQMPSRETSRPSADEAGKTTVSATEASSQSELADTDDGTADSSAKSQAHSAKGTSAEQKVADSVEKLEGLVAQVDGAANTVTSSGGSAEAYQACLARVSSSDAAPPPATLRYLPDRETLIELLEELPPNRSETSMTHLLTLRLGGTPSGATLRSVLQLLRAGGGAQDRIGCLDQNHLIVAIPDSFQESVIERAEQLCHAAAGLGVPLCDPECPDQEEQISIGISPCRAETAAEDAESDGSPAPPIDVPPIDWDHMINRSLAAAALGESHPTPGSKLPVCFYDEEPTPVAG